MVDAPSAHKSRLFDDDSGIRQHIDFLSHRFSVDFYTALRTRKKSADTFKQHRLSRTVVPDDPIDMPALAMHRNIFERLGLFRCV